MLPISRACTCLSLTAGASQPVYRDPFGITRLAFWASSKRVRGCLLVKYLTSRLAISRPPQGEQTAPVKNESNNTYQPSTEGNFLYLALQALKDLEHRVQFEAEALGFPRAFPEIGPANVKGIEIKPYAAELARRVGVDRGDSVDAAQRLRRVAQPHLGAARHH